MFEKEKTARRESILNNLLDFMEDCDKCTFHITISCSEQDAKIEKMTIEKEI